MANVSVDVRQGDLLLEVVARGCGVDVNRLALKKPGHRDERLYVSIWLDHEIQICVLLPHPEFRWDEGYRARKDFTLTFNRLDAHVDVNSCP